MFEDTKLKVFMAVARTGSFTAAARETGMTQPAVSQNIAELEKGVGAPLFDRTRGSVRLTDKGTAFMEYASRILHWYGAMDSMFGPASRLSHPGKIRIEADSFCSVFIVPGLVSALRISSSDLRFIISPYGHGEASHATDIQIYLKAKPAVADLLNSATAVGSVQACAVVSSARPVPADMASFPEGARLALWAPYFSMVPDDLKAMTVLETESVPALEAAVAASQSLIGIIPLRRSLPSSLTPLPAPSCGLQSVLPRLETDLHLQPSLSFSASAIFPRLLSLLDSEII